MIHARAVRSRHVAQSARRRQVVVRRHALAAISCASAFLLLDTSVTARDSPLTRRRTGRYGRHREAAGYRCATASANPSSSIWKKTGSPSVIAKWFAFAGSVQKLPGGKALSFA